ncbi:MAG: DegV family protein [Oscillospiraceae bacterium]|nr:DegV family protein [Oscillospiraceae bacterium]
MAVKRRVKIITDSGCDLPEGWEKTYGIDIMSFEIDLDDITYRERIDVTSKEFYALMNNSSSIPTTNQILVERFEAKFRQCLSDGEREVLMILINSKGSQTYSNALAARKNLEDNGELGSMKVHIIDSRTYSVGYGFAIVEAVKKLDAGQSMDLVLDYLDDWFSCAEVYILPLSLRHMKKSGRITAAAAFLGELMGLKPVISLIDGVSEVLKKVRGENALLDEATKIIKASATPETPWLAVCADEPEFYERFVKRMTKELGRPPAIEAYIGGVVGCNTGPKVAAVVIKGKHRGQMKVDN